MPREACRELTTLAVATAGSARIGVDGLGAVVLCLARTVCLIVSTQLGRQTQQRARTSPWPGLLSPSAPRSCYPEEHGTPLLLFQDARLLGGKARLMTRSSSKNAWMHAVFFVSAFHCVAFCES
jgi:hypothetical protein